MLNEQSGQFLSQYVQPSKNKVSDVMGLSKQLKFTKAEASLFCDAMNGTLLPECADLVALLVSEIEDAIGYDDLDSKWGVDNHRLIEKLNSLSQEECVKLLQTVGSYGYSPVLDDFDW